MSTSILGIGTAVPSNRVVQADAAAFAKKVCAQTPEHEKSLDALYRHTKIQSRHTVLEADLVGNILDANVETASLFAPANSSENGPTTDQRMRRYRAEALPLAVESARKALKEAGLEPGDITHIVSVSCTGFSAPGYDIGLMKTLGMKPTVQRTNVGFMGCHGTFNALRVANALLKADESAKVLIASVELCSLHFFYGWDVTKMVGNALFADGAGCIVVGNGGSKKNEWEVAASGSRLFENCEEDMAWQVGDHGFDMVLSNRIPDLIGANLRPWLDDWLAGSGLSVADVGSWAIHPGGPRILNSIVEVLGVPASAVDTSREVLCQFGNVSSATIIFILERMRQRDLPRPCVALGFGPGLVAEALLLR